MTDRRVSIEHLNLDRRILDTLPDALLVVNAAGLIVQANIQAEVTFGYTRGELLGVPVDTLVPPDVRPAHTALRASYFANPTPRLMGVGRRLTALRRWGDPFPCDIALSSIDVLGVGPLAVAVIRDVTERKYRDGSSH